ncbi:MAG: hypothetical protein WHV26_03480 [Spirochaetota bacterium]
MQKFLRINQVILDHLTYFKDIIENKIIIENIKILQGKLFELYPKPSTLLASLPCAVIGHRIGTALATGGIENRMVGNNVILTRELIKTTHPYQIDFYSNNIYDFLDEGRTGILTQFISEVCKCPYYICNDGRTIYIQPGIFGLLDEPELIEDGPYKAFCQVQIIDALYAIKTVPSITELQLNEGGLYE